MQLAETPELDAPRNRRKRDRVQVRDVDTSPVGRGALVTILTDEQHEEEDIDVPDLLNQPDEPAITCRTNDKATAVTAAGDGGNLQAFTLLIAAADGNGGGRLSNLEH